MGRRQLRRTLAVERAYKLDGVAVCLQWSAIHKPRDEVVVRNSVPNPIRGTTCRGTACVGDRREPIEAAAPSRSWRAGAGHAFPGNPTPHVD